MQSSRGILTGVVAGWIVVIPALQLLRTNDRTAPFIAEVTIGALLFAAIAISLGPRRARFFLAWSLTAAAGALVNWPQLTAPGEAQTFFNSIAAPVAIDAQRAVATLVVVALIISLGMALVALPRRDPAVPLGGLLLVPTIAVIVVLLLGGAYQHVLPALLLTTVAVPLGHRLVRGAVGRHESNKGLGLVASSALGIAAINLAWLIIGSLGLLTGPILLIATLPILMVALPDIAMLSRCALRSAAGLRTPVSLRQNILPVGAGALLTSIGVFYSIAALAPDMGSDSGAAHLAIARRFVQQQSLSGGPETTVFYWHIPTEVIYAGLFALSDDVGAKFMHFGFGILTGLGAGALTAHLAGNRGAGIVTATVIAIPSLVWWLAGQAFVDFAAAFYAIATVCAMVRWCETGRKGWLIIASAIAGWAIATKTVNVGLGPALLLAVLLREHRSVAKYATLSILSGMTALVAWSPWLIRSYGLTGNPVFPWFNNIFRSALVAPVAIYSGVPYGYGTGALALLSLPFSVTYNPAAFTSGGELGAQFLALAPIAFLLFRRSAWTSGLLVVLGTVLMFFIVWAWGLLQNLRYLLPAIPMVATLLVVGLFRAPHAFRFPIMSFAVITALFLSICANALGSQAFWGKAMSGTALPYKVVAGIETRDQYLTTYLPGYRALQFANDLSDDHVQIWAPHY